MPDAQTPGWSIPADHGMGGKAQGQKQGKNNLGDGEVGMPDEDGAECNQDHGNETDLRIPENGCARMVNGRNQ
ncbi:MAG: hypothetical protein H7839_19130 [Magnetococcus sp. YQC-5]